VSRLKRFVEIIENIFAMSVKEEGIWREWHSL
jgi:hypothetical protein